MSARRDKRNGKWRYQKWVTLPNGRRQRIGGTPAINTKRAAEAAEREHVLRVQNPALAATAAQDKEMPSVKTYLPVFMDGHYGEGKPRHREEVERMFNSYLLKRVGDVSLDDFSQDRVNRLRTSLATGRSTKTVDNIVTPLSTLLRYAHTNGLIERPTAKFVRSKRRNKTKIEALPYEDVGRLLNATIEPRYRMAILLAAESGLRQGEIRGLRWKDLKERRFLICRALDTRGRITTPKHDVERTVPISPRIERELERLPKRGEYLVSRLDGGAIGYSVMYERLVEIYKLAEVEQPRQPWHCLRHTFGTRLGRSGVPLAVIATLMGHISIETTQRYLTVLETEKATAVQHAFAEPPRQDGKRVANAETAKTGKR